MNEIFAELEALLFKTRSLANAIFEASPFNPHNPNVDQLIAHRICDQLNQMIRELHQQIFSNDPQGHTFFSHDNQIMGLSPERLPSDPYGAADILSWIEDELQNRLNEDEDDQDDW